MAQLELAVVTAAGRGSRLGPATRWIQKELLNLVDRPALSYLAAEIAGAGIQTMFVVAGTAHRELILRYRETMSPVFLPNGSRLQVEVSRPMPPLGPAHAVAAAKNIAAGRSFALLLGDNIVGRRSTLLSRLVAAHVSLDSSVIGLKPIAPEAISSHGCAVLDCFDGDVARVQSMYEKPAALPVDDGSFAGALGRYVLTSEFFEALAETPPGHGGEYQVTDALNLLCAGSGLYGLICDDVVYDIGSSAGIVDATVGLALERPELAADVRRHLQASRMPAIDQRRQPAGRKPRAPFGGLPAHQGG